MGGANFTVKVKKEGRTSKKAFSDVVDDARYMHGHGGYTGTIAEKHDFVMMRPPSGMTAEDFVDKLEDGEIDDPRTGNPFEDKWGSAGCVDAGDEWIFFGSASC